MENACQMKKPQIQNNKKTNFLLFSFFLETKYYNCTLKLDLRRDVVTYKCMKTLNLSINHFNNKFKELKE